MLKILLSKQFGLTKCLISHYCLDHINENYNRLSETYHSNAEDNLANHNDLKSYGLLLTASALILKYTMSKKGHLDPHHVHHSTGCLGPGGGGILNVEVIGMLVGNFLENPKNTQILILNP